MCVFDKKFINSGTGNYERVIVLYKDNLLLDK